MPKQYAERGKENRAKVGWFIPVRLQVFVASLAKASNRSESSVATELLDAAINRKVALSGPASVPTPPEVQEEAS